MGRRPGDGQPTAVVFDFGGVLITPITNQLAGVATDHGVDVTTMKRVLLGPHEAGDHPWHRAERGELAIADIQAGLGPWAELDGIQLRGDEVERLLAAGEYVVIDAMIERVHTLRAAGVATALLTNTFREFRPTMDRDVGLASFDVVVESFAVGSRKPEPDIYAAVERGLGRRGADLVYLDDFAENLAPADALGWRTIHVTDPSLALDELDTLLR